MSCHLRFHVLLLVAVLIIERGVARRIEHRNGKSPNTLHISIYTFKMCSMGKFLVLCCGQYSTHRTNSVLVTSTDKFTHTNEQNNSQYKCGDVLKVGETFSIQKKRWPSVVSSQ